MGMVGLILFVGLLATAILYVRLKQGCFFKPRFKNNVPEELKPYITKYPMRYGPWGIAPFLERYEKTKEREGTFFSLERFLNEEKELMRIKKKSRR